MAMTLAAFNKLKKTMMMTTSPNDNEALSALRIANRVIAEQGYSWDDVFARLVKVEDAIESMEEEPKPNDDADWITDAFEELGRRNFKSNFITSLAEQWEEKKWLSAPQKEALVKTLNSARRRS